MARLRGGTAELTLERDEKTGSVENVEMGRWKTMTIM